ncbi:hypothetical protein SPRG_04805 [Saprolegnia parasitica CBS 223.65]|uniref:Uncharacterized protein n=1 Tax=Saprolegnia parasitica (strain CBS 223.65) TaxID=695850 RepID=A0A067CVS2_SAPPC|nr:hypothetical protein SPRG_04805 [Saprolegnia parasitica CBS 223.65]KDO30902.1 hypothetical protein SPRG_04805 [Saprolegnia parasitica CBS 223.65]|eukprot:XP_012198595.1 hypothetical protein SPRG_04805 [Saprolegnia parasitica CBS 223.65]
MAQNYIAQKRLHASSKEEAAAHRQASDDSDESEPENDAEPATQPRGKQLRFPVPAASTEGSASDEDSDDYASVSSSDSSDSEDEAASAQVPEKEPQYIILGARARKRVRPPNAYYRNMAAYVRGCLLLVRSKTKTDLDDAGHVAFRAALAANTVERVVIADAPPEVPKPVEAPHVAKPVDEKKEKKKTESEKRSSAKKKEAPSSPAKPAPTTVTPPPKEIAKLPPKPVPVPKADFSAKRSAPVAEAPPAKKARTAGQFLIASSADVADTARILKEMDELRKEGVSLKHSGDRKTDKSATGVEYLRASIKFLRQALLFSDLKAISKMTNDQVKAAKWGKDSTSTIAQTAALIESTIGLFKQAGNRRLMAVSYKLAAIVYLTSYRLQHNMLYGHYSQLHMAGRSPDGLGAPVLSPDQEGMRRLILREMGQVMRGFDFWRYYESTGMSVLPDVTDPVTVDFNVLWDALEVELSASP